MQFCEIVAVANCVASLTCRTATSLHQRAMPSKSHAATEKWVVISQHQRGQVWPNFTTGKLTLSYVTATIKVLISFIGMVDLLRMTERSFYWRSGLIILGVYQDF